MANKKPVHEIRHNGVKAAIWENDGKNGAFYNVTFSRAFKDADDNWRDVHSYGFRQIFSVIRCAVEAQAWIAAKGSPGRD